MESNKKALVVLSGGQDSTTCLMWAMQRYEEVHALTFDYSQRHVREIDAAVAIAERAGVRTHEVLTLGPILKGTSPLVDGNEELEQYASPDALPDGLEKTFVPMRNQLFLTIAANRAYVLGCGTLVTGVCQEDFGGYPDCRQVFIDAIKAACDTGTFTGDDGAPAGLNIETPLMDLSKAESVELAVDEGAFHLLAFSHTSYDGAYPPSGHDHATLLRAKGFIEARLPDPLVMRANREGLMDLPETSNYSEEAIGRYVQACADSRLALEACSP